MPVVLITNATSRLRRDLALVDLDCAIAGIVNSSEVGSAKPAPEIVAVALRRTSTRADRTIFIDDSAESVAAADAPGLRGYRFDGDHARLQVLVSEQLAWGL